MKVLVLTTTFPRWKDDSTPAFVYDLSKQLRNEGMEIIVLAPHHEGAKFYEEMNGLKVYRFPYFYPLRYQKLCYEGGVLPNLKRSWLARIQIPILFLSEFIFVYKIIQKERISAMHSHWIVPNGFVAGIIKRIWDIPHLSTAHAADVLALEKIPFKRYVASFIVKNSHSMTADGSHIKERFLDMLPSKLKLYNEKKILVQPNGVDTGMFEGLNRKKIREKYDINNEFIILFIGRFAEKKGIEYLLEAMKITASNLNDIKLLLVGSGPLEESLRKKVKDLDIEPHVKFMGWANKQKLAEFYVLSDVVVVPSIVSKSGDTEGMPTVIVEALAAGKPVIASDVGGIGDVVINGYNGFLVEEKNPIDITKRIEELFSNHCLYEKISQNAILSGKNYDWSIVGKRYIGLIRGG